jgi:hypothetical protein
VSGAVLEQLKSEEFAVSAAFLSTPASLRRFLARSGEVAAIRQALREGAIAEDSIRQFVSSLLQDFRRGERFQHELAVSALAVALEARATGFAEEFLRDLSRLRLAEMSLCSLVASECLKDRVSLAQNTAKVFELNPHGDNGPFSVSASPWACQRSLVGMTQGTFVCGEG